MNCERRRAAFEGRDAIYVEKGVIRVRVTNIRYYLAARYINADVEEVSTPQLAGGVFHEHRVNPRRWKISAGYLTKFSDHTWQAGYGGWSLFFAPEIVSGLTRLATDWAYRSGRSSKIQPSS